ncbi:hypothetical protein IFM89_036033 [Coptis chinensis]|uniref:HEAT repeat-containing protein n=1 Tax=Coptis chinensis TaxID=261450 RepID=A0A835LHJ6_9MAGN|nr:hypothetical protein IFM89_036033 [Coptis chinensis]
MDVERSSLCNCVVNFLLEENYLLSAFELLHELLDDGRDAHAIRLKEFFSDPRQFPPDQISRLNTLRVADPQSLLEEKEILVEKLAISEYELRLAQEDISRLKEELDKKAESTDVQLNGSNLNVSATGGPTLQQLKRDSPFSDLGPLKDNERKDINCAVKEYLLLAGYRLTTMTFYEEVFSESTLPDLSNDTNDQNKTWHFEKETDLSEVPYPQAITYANLLCVTDQNLDLWQNTQACIPDALRHYYYQYLSSTNEATEVQDLKQSLELERKELNNCRAEITSLKMHIEGSRSSKNWVIGDIEHLQSQSLENYKEEIKSLQMEIDSLKAEKSVARSPLESIICVNHNLELEEKVVEIHEDNAIMSHPVELASSVSDIENTKPQASQIFEDNRDSPEEVSIERPMDSANDNSTVESVGSTYECDSGIVPNDSVLAVKTGQSSEPISEKVGLETIQILSDALPKIVPYVLINHREELLPLIMCAIERHPDSSTRDSLTHTLFNLIKRPDEQQRRIIMDACVTLAKNVGEMRTESELLPQCWEQINHTYEERRLLVAQSCGELAEFVRPEIRDSLILSIVQQLVEDAATVVREAAAHNLALLLPLFPNMDKYYKVEELMFQLACDPSGVVVETSLKELVPAVINWGNKLDHILRLLLSHILGSAQRCAPLSGVQGSVESHLRVLGERERWNIDVLLRMMAELLPSVHQKAIETCPFPSVTESLGTSEAGGTFFSTSLLELYEGGHVEWPAFDWMHTDCFTDLIQLACLLPQKEDNLRLRITKFLLAVSKLFGDHYLTDIMLPVFLVAVGDNATLKAFPSSIQSRILVLQPKTSVSEKLAIMCVLPLLLAGILGTSSRKDQLAEYLRKLLVQSTVREGWSANRTSEIIDAVKLPLVGIISSSGVQILSFMLIADTIFLKCSTFDEHHGIIFNILWEMVVSSNINMKMSAANLLKVLVPYIDAKVASTHVLPALVTLGSDQNLSVKYASIDAFGAVAQHFKTDMIFQLTNTVPPATDVMRRRDRANAFCESIRALDATDLPATSVREFLLPTIHNLLKDSDSLDPAHKEALEIIMKERSGGTFEAISKVMGMSAHLGLPTSVSSFFGEGGLLGKRESGDSLPSESVESPKPDSPAPVEDTRFRRIMRGNFGEMLRGKGKGNEDAPKEQQ